MGTRLGGEVRSRCCCPVRRRRRAIQPNNLDSGLCSPLSSRRPCENSRKSTNSMRFRYLLSPKTVSNGHSKSSFRVFTQSPRERGNRPENRQSLTIGGDAPEPRTTSFAPNVEIGIGGSV